MNKNWHKANWRTLRPPKQEFSLMWLLKAYKYLYLPVYLTFVL
jgi:hypothetical protein